MSSCNDGSSAPSLGESVVDVSPVTLGMKASHDPIAIKERVWARWKSLENVLKYHEIVKNILKGQTVCQG